MPNHMIRRGAEILALTIVYYLTARLGLQLALPPGYATPIWPPAGIALVAVLLFGKRIALGIWLGSFLANLATSFDPASTTTLVRSMLVPLGIGVGATLQAVVGAALIRRFVGYPTALHRTQEVAKFLGLGGPVSCVISASLGLTILLLTGTLPAVSYAFSWWTWWIGDTIGVLVVTPLALTWIGHPQDSWRRRWKTVALPLCLAFAVIVGVFIGARGEFLAVPHSLVAWTVLVSGLMFVGLLGAFLLAMSGHTMLFEELVAQRTAELERTRQAEEVARQLAAIVASSNDAIIGKTLEGIIVSWNAGAERMYGYRASEMLGRSISTLVPPELSDDIPHILQRMRRGERIKHLETVGVRKDGRRINVSVTISPIHDSGGRVTGVSVIAQDITEHKRAEEALREREARIRRLVEANIIGVFFWDIGGKIHEANDAFLKLSGYSREELSLENIRWTDMTPPEYRAVDERAIEELTRSGTCTEYEKEYIHKDGQRIPVLVGSALFEGSCDQGVSYVLDLSARKDAEETVRHMAEHDALTGLPNRTLLQDRVKQAITQARRIRTHMAVLFIDLDYFKQINDSLGHHIGDRLLQMAAARLQGCVREGDSVARLGGDEFILCLTMLSGGSDAALVARKVLDALEETFLIEGHELQVSCSVGISLYPEDGTDTETLMRAADTAMYYAKEQGRGDYQFFTPALNQAAQERLGMAKRLRHALAHDEFVLYYQPQVNIQSGAILSAEALLRWRQPGTAPISCSAFIANAEESGLILPIGEWVLRQACRQLKAWHDAGHSNFRLAVNLSPRQLRQPHFDSLMKQILEEAELPATDLELEITETALLEQSEANLATLTRLGDMGIQLSVDDFGTGYSSLAYLQRFPVHALKIDQTFVRGIDINSNDTTLVTTIIAMANSLRLKVMAEGVETWQQAEFLQSHDCPAAQGFYYSEAVPPEAFLKMLRQPWWQTKLTRQRHS